MLLTLIPERRTRPPGGVDCFLEEEALDYLSRPEGADRVLSHLEQCSDCRLVMGAAARTRTTASGGRRLSTLRPGDCLGGRYRIDGLLARGGMGEVYQAYDQLLEEQVALKTILLTATDNQLALAALKAEVQLARRVSHQNVCRILEFGVHQEGRRDGTSGLPFFTMELLRGETLRERLVGGGPLTVEEALPMALQVIDGLAAIHGQGIVHRDLKPENVFLLRSDAGLRAVVMDFGLARPADLTRSLPSTGSSQGGGPVGTLEYMAPEQLRGARPTVAVDVYALGTILFELLHGSRPPRPAPKGRLHRPEAPTGWEPIIARCLAQRPGDRYPSMGALRDDLLRAAGATMSAGVRRRWRSWGITSAIILLVGGALLGTRGLPPRWPAPVTGAAVSAPRSSTGSRPLSPLPPKDPEPDTAGGQRPSGSAPVTTKVRGHRQVGKARGSRPAGDVARPAATGLPMTPSLLQQGEDLLVGGAVETACARGERAAALQPWLPEIQRFLGKCYMRLSRHELGRLHYRRYLSLAPEAPDALFVQAIVDRGGQRP